MRILAVDTSSQSASCALTEDGRLLGECFTNVRLTHSQTLMPMIEGLFAQTQTSIESVDLFAVTEGPGSFTGLRIGLSAVKAWRTRSAALVPASPRSRRSPGTCAVSPALSRLFWMRDAIRSIRRCFAGQTMVWSVFSPTRLLRSTRSPSGLKIWKRRYFLLETERKCAIIN